MELPENMKRLHLFCGHYGSGKTNLAVNFALWLSKKGLPVTVADLDIVNPYFRSADSEEELKSAGIKVIKLPFANTSVDLPSLPSEAYMLVEDRSRYGILDVGGDDRGALALGRYVPGILAENNYEMYFVVNFSRPLTRTAEDAIEVKNEIEQACGIPFTSIINNTNLGAETTKDLLLSSMRETEKLSALTGLPVAFTSAEESVAKDLPDVFSMKLQKRPTDR